MTHEFVTDIAAVAAIVAAAGVLGIIALMISDVFNG
jgi:hypothetical protein